MPNYTTQAIHDCVNKIDFIDFDSASFTGADGTVKEQTTAIVSYLKQLIADPDLNPEATNKEEFVSKIKSIPDGPVSLCTYLVDLLSNGIDDVVGGIITSFQTWSNSLGKPLTESQEHFLKALKLCLCVVRTDLELGQDDINNDKTYLVGKGWASFNVTLVKAKQKQVLARHVDALEQEVDKLLRGPELAHVDIPEPEQEAVELTIDNLTDPRDELGNLISKHSFFEQGKLINRHRELVAKVAKAHVAEPEFDTFDPAEIYQWWCLFVLDRLDSNEQQKVSRAEKQLLNLAYIAFHLQSALEALEVDNVMDAHNHILEVQGLDMMMQL